MGSGVDHLCGRVGVRKMSMRTDIPKTELEHSHARNADPFAKRMDIGRDVAQILGEKRQPTQGVAQTIEQIVFGTVNPAPIDGSLLSARNFPKLGEASKVIEPDVIKIVCRPAQA